MIRLKKNRKDGMTMGKKTGAKIKEARTAAGFTQEQLAKQLDGISASDISKAERGEAELTQAVLKQIAKLTGVTQASLLNAEKSSDAKSSAAKPAAKTTAAKKAAASKTPEEIKLTAGEKTLLELYRKADSDTKKAALAVLKGEGNDIQKLISGVLGSAFKEFMK